MDSTRWAERGLLLPFNRNFFRHISFVGSEPRGRVPAFTPVIVSVGRGYEIIGTALPTITGVAIEAYEAVLKSIGTSARSVGVMRNLTISYENVARHEDAYRLAGEALSFDRAGLTTDLYFMCAAAEAQASLGKMKGARDTLTLLAAKKPEFREHPRFKAAVDVVQEKRRANPGE